MRLTQRFVGLARCLLQRFLRLLRRITANIFVAAIAAADGDQQRHRIRADDTQAIRLLRDLPALDLHARQRLELHRIDLLMRLDAVTVQHKRSGALRLDTGLLRAGVTEGKGDLAGLIRRQAQHDHLIRRARKRLPQIVHTLRLVGDALDGRIQIKLPPVVGHSGRRAEVEFEVAYRLIRRLPGRTAHEMRIHEILRLLPLVGEDQAANLGQRGQSFGTVVVVRAARPERAFVELESLFACAAVHHCGKASIAYRQGVQPFRRRLVVPQHERRRTQVRFALLRAAGRCQYAGRSQRCRHSYSYPYEITSVHLIFPSAMRILSPANEHPVCLQLRFMVSAARTTLRLC